MGSVFRHSFHSPEARWRGSIQIAHSVHPQGRTPGAGNTVTLYDTDGTTVLGTTTASASGSWAITTSTLGLGVHALKAIATDAAGDTPATSSALSLTIAAPLVVAFASARLATSQANPILSGTAAPGSTVTLTLDGVALGSTLSNSATGQWAFQLGSAPAAGSHVVTAQAANSLGTSATATASLLQYAAASSASSPSAIGGTVPAGVINATTTSYYGVTPQFSSGTSAVAYADGTLSVGTGTDQAFIARLYIGVLGRSGSALELSGWNALLAAGQTQQQIAQSFLSSGEAAPLAAQSNTQFVATLYQTLLGRSPSASESNGLVSQLGNGTSRALVLASIAGSAESQQALSGATQALWVPTANGTLVDATYQTAFGRLPDMPAPWITALNAGLSVTAFEQSFASQAEYVTLHGSQGAADLVTSLYQNGLGRAPSAAELANNVTALNGGSLSAAGLLQVVATSNEAATYVTSKLLV
jgi:hypothetical protein